MKKIITIFLLIALASCSGIKPINNSTTTTLPDSVSVEDAEEVLSEGDITPKEETVRLGVNGGDVYHSFEESAFDKDQIVAKVRIGLNLGPGLYRSTQFISLLKFLEREQLTPKVIAGTEFGAIIAAMYASGMTPEVIEWTFFKYFKEKSNAPIYSAAWLKEIEEILLSQIKVKDIEDCKIKFFITLNDSTTNKTYFFNRGNIVELLKQNLMLKKERSLFGKENKYVSAMTTEVFNPRLLKIQGADFTISADALMKGHKISQGAGDIKEAYNRSYAKAQSLKKGFDFNYTLGKEGSILDSNADAPKYNLEATKQLNASEGRLKLKIHNKYLKDNQEH